MCQNMADRIRIPEDRNKCKDILIFLQLYVTVQPSLAAAQPGTFVSWTYNVES